MRSLTEFEMVRSTSGRRVGSVRRVLWCLDKKFQKTVKMHCLPLTVFLTPGTGYDNVQYNYKIYSLSSIRWVMEQAVCSVSSQISWNRQIHLVTGKDRSILWTDSVVNRILCMWKPKTSAGDLTQPHSKILFLKNSSVTRRLIRSCIWFFILGTRSGITCLMHPDDTDVFVPLLNCP